MSIFLKDFDYNLPPELIATTHADPRDSSRLLVVDRCSGKTEDRRFHDIVDFLDEGDVLVFNNSKVFKARIFGSKKTGGKIEFLLVRSIVEADPRVRPSSDWEVLAKGKLKVGDKVLFEGKVEAEVLEKNERTLRVRFDISAEKMFKYLEKNGEIPLPPYVKQNNPEVRPPGVPRGRTSGRDPENFYQTIYASNTGSVAAPTAGFHFTDELLDALKKKGVECLEVTLHVGPGTFLPVEAENVSEHKMHEEFFEVKKETWERIVAAKKEGRMIIAVGTTTCRVLESMIREYPISLPRRQAGNTQYPINNTIPNTQTPNNPKDLKNPNDPELIMGSTDIFIYPPYDFQIVDALITNFHLPRSTLLMLVSAFLSPGKTDGIKGIKKIYQEAIDDGYRFYSFGDSMLIK